MPKITNKSAEQKVAEADVESFRKDLGRFVVAAETTRMAMVFADAKEPSHLRPEAPIQSIRRL